MTTCVQSVAMLGSELWWNSDQTQGTIRRVSDWRLLVNWEVGAITGCFWTTNLGALAMESGLRPATARLENRLRRLGHTLKYVPQGNQAKKIVGGISRDRELRCCRGAHSYFQHSLSHNQTY